MRKILGILFFLFTFSFFGFSQFTVKFSSATANQNDTANINVTVDNLTNLFGAQFSVNWDSTKFKFGKISNINTTLGMDFTFATPDPSNAIKQGTMSFLWASSEPKTLPNNTVIFTVRLKAVGEMCDSTEVFTSNNPTTSEYYDANFQTFPLTNVVKGKAKINGTECDPIVMPPDTAVIVTAATLTAAPGTEICVPITVENFEDIEGAQSKIKWDPTVLQFKEIKNSALPSIILNTANSSIGEVSFLWTPPGSSGPVTIPDGGLLLEICFTVIGANGAMTTIDLVDADNTPFETEFTDSNGDPIPFINNDGKVTVGTPPPADLKVTVADVTVNKDASVDVSFKVDNFIDLTAFQFAITWDAAIATFENRNTDGVSNLDGNLVTTNRYNVQWLSQSPVTLPNGSTLFNIRFKGVGCDLTSVINIQNFQDFDIQFINKNVQVVPYTIDPGSIKVVCVDPPMPICTILSSTNVDCNGQSTGSITAQVTNGTDDCQCIWKKDGQAFGSPLPIASCNLINIPAGQYVLEVTCSGVVKSTCNVTITEPSAIVIGGSVTNVGCADKGSITLNVTGGTPNYTYKWDANAGGATTKDVAGLNAGTYTVTVTDNKLCTSNKSFIVTTITPEPLVVTNTKEDVKCFGASTGSIALNISGGCPDYTIAWVGEPNVNTGTRVNLKSGNYTYIVTDKSNPANTATNTITINQPATDIVITEVVTDASNGNNGSINITATGGTGTLKYSWTGGIIASTEDISNLSAGTYNLLVTDDNGCTKSKTYTVKDTSSPEDITFTISVPSENINAGYGVSCVNLCDAIIAGVVDNKGTAPYTVTLSGPVSKTFNLAQAGNYQFTGLCVGTYTVKVTDSTGKSATKTEEVTQPSIITVTSDVDCSEGILSNGAIDLTVTGGAGSYTYDWNTGDEEQDLNNLAIGRYNVVVSDANGCQQLLENINVRDCTIEEGCYEGISIITPNNDGVNDYFIISCALDIDNELFIYDRWGKLVYSRKNYDNTWNGESLSGDQLKENGYMWVFNYENNGGTRESVKGTVTLLRD